MKMISYILALVFLLSGGAKLASLPFEVEAFARWGYPAGFMYLTGILEVLGAIGLLIPRVSSLSAFCLAGLMAGAIATHAIHGEWRPLVVAALIALLAAVHCRRGRQEIKQLFTRNLD